MKQRILFFITEDWFFCSHFLNRAIVAQQEGYRVTIVTRVQSHGDKILSHGFQLIPLNIVRRGMNPCKELRLIHKLALIYKSVKPDIVHNIALKPILYGSIAAHIAHVPVIINAPVGMGYVFSSKQWQAGLLRPFIILLFRLFLNPENSYVILENSDDLQMMINACILSSNRSTLIRGAGVDLKLFLPKAEPEGDPIVILASRMLWDKGVGEFVEAARILEKEEVKCRMILVGDPDPENPASISEKMLRGWHAEGIVECWGHREDMPEVFAQSNIAVLPSYREGLPKVLLEAASCGRPIVATDVPGCREIVSHNKNGFLVPPHNSKFLADALKVLIKNPELRVKMGVHGRKIVEAEFSEEIVARQTMEVYERLSRRLQRNNRSVLGRV